MSIPMISILGSLLFEILLYLFTGYRRGARRPQEYKYELTTMLRLQWPCGY